MAEGRRVMTRITNRRIGVKCPETHFLGLVKTKTKTNGSRAVKSPDTHFLVLWVIGKDGH